MTKRPELPPPLDRILSMAEVVRLTSYSRSSIYRLEGDGKFPKRIKVGDNKIGWWESVVRAWLDGRPLA